MSRLEGGKSILSGGNRTHEGPKVGKGLMGKRIKKPRTIAEEGVES